MISLIPKEIEETEGRVVVALRDIWLYTKPTPETLHPSSIRAARSE
jgi:hypothetical protein